MIPYGRQTIDESDVQAVLAALRSDFLTQGPLVGQFEKALADYCGATHAVAVSNGTAALHLACLALGLGPGDLLWTSPISFVASANCARYCGAEVDFVDIDPTTRNLCPEALRLKLEQAEAIGRLPKVLVVVHFSGLPADMQAISALARRYGVHLVEDACHALGAEYQGRRICGGDHSDLTIFSFHPVKSITTGEGGALLTNHAELARRCRLLASHGIEREAVCLQSSAPAGWYYEQQQLGYNYRITDLQCALGISQLARLDAFVAARRAVAQGYREQLAALPVRLPAVETEGARSAWHLFAIALEGELPRDAIFERLRQRGVGVQLHYWPIHLQPYYRALGFGEGQFPVAEHYARRAISLPIFPTLSAPQQQAVVDILADVLAEFGA